MDERQSLTLRLQSQSLTRSTQVLTGIITGIVADGQLHDMEIQMLNTWLSKNQEVATIWPGSAVARHLREVLADGVITADEKAYLLTSLQQLIGTEFAETGSVSTDTDGLPFDHDAEVRFAASGICLTGEFLYGTRAACEKLSEKAGAVPMGSVSKKVAYLIIGTHASPNWVNTSYGRKIQKAMELKEAGHLIAIIPEKRWVEAIGS